ncbi:ATP-dependent helicase/nuclease subunit B [Rhizobiales bacterium GAS113]|nr:ATP-dependent helicase/nuclease subunit B [Rhizobiales bacterium GAS113]
MTARSAHIFSIPFGVDFLDALADALFDGPLKSLIDFDSDPLVLAAATIHVPTRRAGRALAGKLAERLGGRTALLPRILPLGEADALELGSLADSVAGEEIAPAIGEMQRLLQLANLVSQWSQAVDRATLKLADDEAFTVASGAAGVMSLSAELARLIDGLHLEGVPLAELTRLDAADFQEIWRISATFLRIAGAAWPSMLAEAQRLDPADRHGRLVRAYAQRLRRDGSSRPVIAVGSTGSIQSTAELLAAIAALPNGAVVLPGLDRNVDLQSWSLLAGDKPTPSHPQYGLRRLIDQMGIGPEEVEDIGKASSVGLAARGRLLTEAMRPAETTEAWGALASRASEASEAGEAGAAADDIAQGFEGIGVVEAPDERLEALAVALTLREAIETPDHVAALITPDRGLAERVAIELARWGITADDSAGIPLSRSLAGRLALTIAELASSGLEAQTLLALLGHPLTHLGLPRAAVERGTTAIDIALLRGRPMQATLGGLRDALAEASQAMPEHPSRPRARLAAQDFAAAGAIIDALEGGLDQLLTVAGLGEAPLPRLAEAHAQAIDAVTRLADGGSTLEGADAEELTSLFADLAECRDEGPNLPASAYAPALRALMQDRAVTLSSPGHRRVKIWGLLEARLLKADTAVLGGLVEGTWPARIAVDPFLSRGMRAQLGLSPPERRIGQMAHDFVSACGAARCVLTRPLKSQGADTIPSRFLQRLEAVAGKALWSQAKARGSRLLGLAALLDEAGPLAPVAQPSPRVPAKLQPRRLSVTAVETLLRDPYAIFARHVLQLDKLDPLGLAFDARLQGSIWHAALAQFVESHPCTLPANASDDLLRIGRELIAPHLGDPQVEGFVWPRFQRAAHWFIDWERRRRGDIERIVVETSSQLDMALADGEEFRLTARPDRVERHHDGTLAIVDFKTGAPPSQRDVLSGFSPQLTLEAAILRAGGLTGLPSGAVSELCHVALSGGRPAGKDQPVRLKDGGAASLDELAAAHLAGVREVLADYRAEGRGFTSRPFPAHAPAFSDYEHLARIAEWSDEAAEETQAE